MVSSCPYRYSFSSATAPRSIKLNPCTNRPVGWTRCPSNNNCIWSYNLQQHILTSHGAQGLCEMTEYLQNLAPPSSEFGLMGVGQGTGNICPAMGSKRRREAEHSASGATNPSSSKKKSSNAASIVDLLSILYMNCKHCHLLV